MFHRLWPSPGQWAFAYSNSPENHLGEGCSLENLRDKRTPTCLVGIELRVDNDGLQYISAPIAWVYVGMPVLADLSEIRVGASPRGRLEVVAAGGERVVHAKDLGPDGSIDSDRLIRVMDRFGETALRLRPGDVLLQSRGVSYPVGFATEDTSGAVPISPLCLIRPNSGQLDGAFLALFLAHPRTQQRLRAQAAGTHVPELTREAVANVEIPLPSLPLQREIAALGQLMRRERELLQRLAAAQDSLLFGLIEESAKAPGGAQTPPGERRSAGAPTPAGHPATPLEKGHHDGDHNR